MRISIDELNESLLYKLGTVIKACDIEIDRISDITIIHALGRRKKRAPLVSHCFKSQSQ